MTDQTRWGIDIVQQGNKANDGTYVISGRRIRSV